jgi:vancomycin permeability regulator SanA
MKQYALDKGIASEDIFMDHAGISTYDSIYRAKEIFQADNVIIVTQQYHLYRALYISESLGINAYGVSADPRVYVGQELRDLREIMARAKDFLGDVIPVSGDGTGLYIIDYLMIKHR